MFPFSESSFPTLPPEYVQVLAALIRCLASDAQAPLRTAEDITLWLHGVTRRDVEQALAGGSDHRLITRAVQCVLANTRHPLLADWTPEQIADWCQRTRLQDVQVVLAAGSA